MKLVTTNRIKISVIVFVSLLLGFLWGGVTYYKQIFPFEQIRFAKNFLVGGSLQDKNQPKPRNTLFQTFSRNSSVVMIGDSITEDAEWEEIFPHISIANRGIGGDTAADILRRLDPIYAVNAKKAFLMVGTNDVNAGYSTNEILKNYIEIVQQLSSKGIEVYIQSTLECNKQKCGSRLKKIRELNHELKAYAAIHHLPYININANLTTDSEGLLPKFTLDGIHLLGPGYLIWSQNLAPSMN